MKIELAQHFGMCFGVRDALRKTHEFASNRPVTILGQLVHNPLVEAHLHTLGVREGKLGDPDSASTSAVVISAHGASDKQRGAWLQRGHEMLDTTCPLVKRAHRSLECLVLAGFFPVVIGRPDHVEVQGLVGDFPEAVVVMEAEDMDSIPAGTDRIGIVSQTTQPAERVSSLVSKIKERFPQAEVRFVDTICQPTKDRQASLEQLCQGNDIIVVVGGNNSNNTRQLAETARQHGCRAHHIESPDELRASWFSRNDRVGVTAGTSTLDETVFAVVERLRLIARDQESLGIFDTLKALGK